MANSNVSRQAQRWEDWCAAWDSVESEVFTLFHTRWMWRAITSLMAAGVPRGQDPHVQNYLTRTYVGTVCTAVRRETDTDTRTTSLARCLRVLVETPQIATRAWFVAEARRQRDHSGSAVYDSEIEESFDRFAPDGGPHVDPAIAEAALSQLKASAIGIREYTNKVLAHRDRDGRVADLTPSWTSINHALDSLGATMSQFYTLRHPAQILFQVTPSMSLQFVKMFQVPWWAEGWTPPSDRDPWTTDRE